MATKQMSLRQIAAQMDITPAYLSYMVNGKRPWRADLYELYCQLVNTSVNTTLAKGPVLSTKSRLHLHGVQGAASSNLAAPTIEHKSTYSFLCLQPHSFNRWWPFLCR